jgi:hypothetical protein
MADLLLFCEEPYRSDLKPARTSSENSCGCPLLQTFMLRRLPKSGQLSFKREETFASMVDGAYAAGNPNINHD